MGWNKVEVGRGGGGVCVTEWADGIRSGYRGAKTTTESEGMGATEYTVLWCHNTTVYSHWATYPQWPGAGGDQAGG